MACKINIDFSCLCICKLIMEGKGSCLMLYVGFRFFLSLMLGFAVIRGILSSWQMAKCKSGKQKKTYDVCEGLNLELSHCHFHPHSMAQNMSHGQAHHQWAWAYILSALMRGTANSQGKGALGI